MRLINTIAILAALLAVRCTACHSTDEVDAVPVGSIEWGEACQANTECKSGVCISHQVRVENGEHRFYDFPGNICSATCSEKDPLNACKWPANQCVSGICVVPCSNNEACRTEDGWTCKCSNEFCSDGSRCLPPWWPNWYPDPDSTDGPQNPPRDPGDEK